MLSNIGFSKEAEILLNDPNLTVPEVFNIQKAWTEYINRIIGVLSGLFSLVFFLSLFKIRRHVSRLKFWAGIVGFIMMIFNAWLGSIVVATNLFPVIISIHYLAAYAVLALFMFSIVNARIEEDNLSIIRYKWFFTFFVLISLIQVVYGTRLREIADRVVAANTSSSDLTPLIDSESIFRIHWFIAVTLVFVSLIPVFTLRKKISRKWFRIILMIPFTLLIQYFSGVINLRLGFPLPAQVSHIFFAGVIFGITLYICIAVFRAPKTSPRI